MFTQTITVSRTKTMMQNFAITDTPGEILLRKGSRVPRLRFIHDVGRSLRGGKVGVIDHPFSPNDKRKKKTLILKARARVEAAVCEDDKPTLRLWIQPSLGQIFPVIKKVRLTSSRPDLQGQLAQVCSER